MKTILGLKLKVTNLNPDSTPKRITLIDFFVCLLYFVSLSSSTWGGLRARATFCGQSGQDIISGTFNVFATQFLEKSSEDNQAFSLRLV